MTIIKDSEEIKDLLDSLELGEKTVRQIVESLSKDFKKYSIFVPISKERIFSIKNERKRRDIIHILAWTGNNIVEKIGRNKKLTKEEVEKRKYIEREIEEFLGKLLEQDLPVSTQEIIIRFLGKMKTEIAFDQLVKKTQAEENYRVRRNAISALRAITGNVVSNVVREKEYKLIAIETLMQIAEEREIVNGEDRNIEIITAAILNLRNFIKHVSVGEIRGQEKEDERKIVKQIGKTFLKIIKKRKNQMVLCDAIYALEEMNELVNETFTEEEINEIKIALARKIKQDDKEVQKQAVNTFFQYIKKGLVAEDKEIRYKTVQKMTWLAENNSAILTEEITPIIKNLTKDEFWGIRKEILKIFEMVEIEDKEKILIERLNDEKQEVQHRAAKILGEYGERGNEKVREAIRPLEEVLNQTDSKDVRFWFAFALTQIQGTRKGSGYKALQDMEEDGQLGGSWLTMYEKLFQVKQEKKTIFISYAWDSKEHKEWVKNVAKELEKEKDIKAELDQWDLELGEYLTEFIDKIAEADYTFIIFTNGYVEKLKKKSGGVRYEKLLIDALKLEGREPRRTVVIMREKGLREKIPPSLKGKNNFDMINDELFKENIADLIRHVKGIKRKRE